MTGATGDRTRSKASVAATVACWSLHDARVVAQDGAPVDVAYREHPALDEREDAIAGLRRQGVEVGQRPHPPELVEVAQHLGRHEGPEGRHVGTGCGEDLGGRLDGGVHLAVERQPAPGVEPGDRPSAR